MKQQIGPIYLILGLMAVSALTIGAGKPGGERAGHAVRAQALLPSPTSFHFEVSKNGKKSSDRVLVISSDAIDADIEAEVAKALAVAKARKAG